MLFFFSAPKLVQMLIRMLFLVVYTVNFRKLLELVFINITRISAEYARINGAYIILDGVVRPSSYRLLSSKPMLSQKIVILRLWGVE